MFKTFHRNRNNHFYTILLLRPFCRNKASWIRPLLDEEIAWDARVKSGDFIMGHIIRLRSKRAINAEDCEIAATVAYNMFQGLRLCVADREGKLWLKEMKSRKIDFEVIRNAKIDEELLKLQSQPFDSRKGPLWKIRLFPWISEHQEFINGITKYENQENDNSESDLKIKNLNHVCHLIISYHHGFLDGNSSMILQRYILHILDKILTDGAVSNDDNFEIYDVKKRLKIVDDFIEKFQQNPQHLEETKKDAEKYFVRPDFLDAFPVDLSKPHEEKIIFGSLDRTTNARFIQNCKNNGIGVYSGLTTAVDTAIVDLLQEGGCFKESYLIPSLHCVNERNFIEGSALDIGYGMRNMKMLRQASKNINNDFWNHAKVFHEEFQRRYQDQVVFQELALQKLTDYSIVPDDPNSILEKKTCHYYCMSNMTKYPYLKTENVAIDWCNASTRHTLGTRLWLTVFFTYDGKLEHCFTYNKKWMSAEVAEKLFERIFAIIRKMAEK